jgi:hypothetical protein
MERIHHLASGGEDINVNAAGRKFLFAPFSKKLLVSVFFVLRFGAAFAVIFIDRVNRDVTAVQKFDDIFIGERTRPHRKGSSSAPAEIHAAIVREDKQRPFVFYGQTQTVPNVLGPTDLIENFLLRLWLPFLDPLGNLLRGERGGNRNFSEEQTKQRKDGAFHVQNR